MTTWAEDHSLEVSLLEAYCSDTASPEQAAQIAMWFTAHPDRQVWHEQLKAGLRRDDFPPIMAQERTAAWSAFIEAARQRCPPRGEIITRTIREWFTGTIERAVAMLLDTTERELSDAEERQLRERIDRTKQGAP